MRQIGRKVKQVLSLVLAIVLIVTMIPQSAVSVYGEELEEVVTTESGVDSEATTEVEAEAETEVATEVNETEELEIESEDSNEVNDFELEYDNESEEVSEEELSEEFLVEDNLLEDDEMELNCENGRIMNSSNPNIDYTVTFDANGGLMKIDENNFDLVNEYEGFCEKQSFNYFQVDETEKYGVCVSLGWDEIKPTKNGYTFVGWYDSEGEPYPYSFFDTNTENRTYYAKWQKILEPDDNIPAPTIDKQYGNNGVYFKNEGRKLYYSFKIPKSSYGDIEVDPETEVLKLYVEHAAISPIVNNKDHKWGDGFYHMAGATCTVDQNKDVLEVEYPLFDYPINYNAPFKLNLQYVVIKKDSENNPNDFIDMDTWENVLRQSERIEESVSGNFSMAKYPNNIPSPSLDKEYGKDGIKYSFNENNLSISFRVSEDDYKDIELDEDEILKLVFYYGAKKPNVKNWGHPETSGSYKGYYLGWNAETVKDGKNGVRTEAVTVPGGIEGEETHVFSDGYFTVTVPLFDSEHSYYGYTGDVYLGLKYVILNTSNCPNIEHETIDMNRTFDSKISEAIFDKPEIVTLQYNENEVNTGIFEGETKVTPFLTHSQTDDFPVTEEWYALDKNTYYDFKSETKGSGYKINKVAYTAGKTKANWAASKSFSPVDGALIAVDSQAIYAAVLTKEGETEALSPDAKGVYSASFMDTINFEIKKGNTTITPAKIVTKVGKNVVETLEDGISPDFYSKGNYYGQKVTIELYEEGIANAVTTCSVQVTAPISSVTLKNKNVLIPAIDGGAVTSVVTVNKGANVNNLGFKFEGTDANTGDLVYVDSVNYLEVTLENGVLKIKPLEDCEVGRTIDIVFYDKENTAVSWDEQAIKDNKYSITIQAPAWAKKTPNASLLSANDYQLDFKVTAPSGVKFDNKYYVAVKLSSNKNTAKDLKEGLSVNDTVKYIQINSDGTIPSVSLNAFKYESNGSEVEELGEGCGTSLDAEVYVVLTKNGDAPSDSTILASTAYKKLTVSTKTPYYADKITLKKVNTNVYAGEEKVIATVDFGKNATYTRQEDWEIDPITNQSLMYSDIYVMQDGNYGIKILTRPDTKPGTYTVFARTTTSRFSNAPASASITFKVLPTATDVEVAPITIYHKQGSAASYAVKPVVTDQTETVIKNASVSDYEIGEWDEGTETITPVKGLTFVKGKIKVDKNFTASSDKTYKIRLTAKCGKTLSASQVVNIVESKTDLKEFDFENPGTTSSIEDTMTLDAYNHLGWSDQITNLPVILGVEDIKNAGIVIKDANGAEVSEKLLKEVKIPNPLYIKKAGKITLSATAIDGTKLSKTVNIVKTEEGAIFTKLHLQGNSIYSEYVMEDGNFNVSGESANTVYSIWLSDAEQDELNTKTQISGNKLSISGAKIINNYHDDYLTFEMTKSTATITLTAGKSKLKYYIYNDIFDKKVPKLTAEKKKLYAGYIMSTDIQTLDYTFDKPMEKGFTPYADSTNKLIKEYLESGEIYVAPINEGLITVGVNPIASNGLKAGSYPISLELFDGDGKCLCKPIKLTLKLEKLKKSYKLMNKYTLSEQDAVKVMLSAVGSGVKEIENVVLYNYNNKGKYNDFVNYFGTCTDRDDSGSLYYGIKIGDDVEHLPDVKSMTGCIAYSVKYIDGTTEQRYEKITVNIAQQAHKYKADTPKVAYADIAGSAVEITVYADNKPIGIAKADVLDEKSLSLIQPGSILVSDGKLNLIVDSENVKKPGKIKLVVNVIPNDSKYWDTESVTADNSIPVSVTINITR